jgi:hypothetical protein
MLLFASNEGGSPPAAQPRKIKRCHLQGSNPKHQKGDNFRVFLVFYRIFYTCGAAEHINPIEKKLGCFLFEGCF